MQFGNDIPKRNANIEMNEKIENPSSTHDAGRWKNDLELPKDMGEWQDSIPLTEDMIIDEDEDLSAEPNEATLPKVEGTSNIRCPENHGEWSGERGNSTWQPDPEYIPPEKCPPPKKPYSNPDNLTGKELLEKYGIEGIEFKDGYPVFDDISRGNVEIDGFETGGQIAKAHNFAKANRAMAEERGCTPQEVEKWMKENNYTWHECEDRKTMQKVPNEIHANVPHDGGRCQKDGE